MKYHQSFLLLQVALIVTKSHKQELFLSLYAILESTTELWQQRMSPKSFKFKIHWNPDKSTYLFY
jgi:hypothetical protein